MSIKTESRRSHLLRNSAQFHRVWLGILVLLFFFSPAVSAQYAPHTTVVIFADQPMPDGLWPALESALREELVADSAERQYRRDPAEGARSDAQFEITHGDQVRPGIVVEQSVTVFLHGECVTSYTLRPDLSRPVPVSGALGWVPINDGHIDPFIHISCSRLGQMLGQQGLGRSLTDRNNLMAAAISHVILHEWIHISTQNKHHSQHGVTQAQFGVAELLTHQAKAHDPLSKTTHTVAKSSSVGDSHSLNGGR